MIKKSETPFDVYVQINGYAAETLINGNISECIKYLKGLIEYGLTGIGAMHDALMRIKEECPDRYDYIRAKVFSI